MILASTISCYIQIKVDFRYLLQMRTVALLAILIVLSFSQDPNLSRPTVSKAKQPFSGTFAATWLGGFCFESTKCDAQNLNKWDRESFTIHGLWPSARTEKPIAKFKVENIISNSSLYNNLSNYWPPQSSSSKKRYFLWDWEYNKHGRDFVDILQVYKPREYKGLSNEKLQQAYFQAGLRFYHMIKLTKINLQASPTPVELKSDGTIILTKNQLASIIGIGNETFVLNCRRGTNLLEEIQICYRIQTDLRFTLEDCSKIKKGNETPYPLADNCQGSKIRMVHYKSPAAPSQDQVTKFQPLAPKAKKAQKRARADEGL